MKQPVAGLGLLFAAVASLAADGLVPPDGDVVWPRWRARIAVQTPSVTPQTAAIALNSPLARHAGMPTSSGGAQSATVLGDYYFTTRSFGAFRASGGLMSGLRGGVPLATVASGPRLGLGLHTSASVADMPSDDALVALPYFGLGFSGTFWRDGPALTADLGLVVDRTPSARRAMLGNQGVEDTLREIRLSPVMQLGIRYAF